MSLRLPRYMPAGVGSLGLLVLYLAALLGFQAQALFGLSGSHVDFAFMPSMRERWSGYTRIAAVSGPTRAELQLQAARSRAERLGLGSRRTASALWLGQVAPEWLAELGRGSRGPGTLLWPVESGMYGRGFGSGSNGYHLAVDIDGARGSNVLAAASGLVGYAGNELNGYGNLVMLIHRGGWITLYAHNKSMLVKPGQRVLQGQPIAELGSTGRSMGPHVHFELLHQGRNCDPLPLFRYGQSQRPERLPDVALAQWFPDQERPSAVRCARRKDHPHPSHDLNDPEIGPENAPDSDDLNSQLEGESKPGPLAVR